MRIATGIRTGDGQTRRCRDWTTLSKWATEHTACDGEGAASALFPTQNLCHGDSDGLLPELNWSKSVRGRLTVEITVLVGGALELPYVAPL
jgi:hypothetical protein